MQTPFDTSLKQTSIENIVAKGEPAHYERRFVVLKNVNAVVDTCIKHRGSIVHVDTIVIAPESNMIDMSVI